MAGLLQNLGAEQAYIFRILHRDGLPWVLENGLHCKNANKKDPAFVEIGNPDLIQRRAHHPVPISPHGTLSDYVPFYFTPFSPMMYNIYTGYAGITKRRNDEIVILIASLRELAGRHRFLFTDRHAYLAAAQFFDDLKDLDKIDWPILKNRDFKRDANDPSKVERYQAEALVHRHLPSESLLGIVAYSATVEAHIQSEVAKRGLGIKTAHKPDWYF